MSVNYATFTGTIARNSIHQGVSSNGKAWANFRIISRTSTYDKETGTYKKEPNFYCDCVAFGNLATTIEPILKEGASLLVSGHFTTKGYENNGQQGTDNQLTCENVAVNCTPWQTINVTVNNSNSTPTNQSTQPTQQPQQQMQTPGMNPQVSGAWNTIPMTAQPQQYPMSGAAALGISDDPSF